MTKPDFESNADASDSPASVHVIDAKHEPYRVYHVVGADQTAVQRTAKEVAQGSKLLSNVDLWSANFEATISKVQQWCEQHSDAIRAALVDARSNKVLFYFVPAMDTYDLTLGSEMTDLEVQLGGSSGIGYVESLQVPAKSIDRFVGPKSLIIWQKKNDNLFVAASPATSKPKD